ncbi:MAG: hypothetical protein RCG15_01430 [Candidatus Rickettsia vulgarisii]
MINQTIPTAIIIIPKNFQYFNNQLAEDVIATWRRDGKAIQLQEANDYLAIEQLVIEVKLSKNHPVTILIEDELSNTPYYSLLWSVLGALLVADLITVTYL